MRRVDIEISKPLGGGVYRAAQKNEMQQYVCDMLCILKLNDPT